MIVQRSYGLNATIRRLGGENENYEATTHSGERFVLKISAPGDLDKELASVEKAAVDAVKRECPDLSVPEFVETLEGQIVLQIGNGQSGRLLTYVQGEAWPSSLLPTTQFRSVGRQIGRLARALATIDHPAAHRTHPWDLTKAGQFRERVAAIPSPSRRALASQALRLWTASAEPHLGSLPHALIHGDLNDDNLRVKNGQLHGVLDFGDCLWNPRICELAIAMAYLLFDEPAPLEGGAEIVAGYHEIQPLIAAEIETLFPLICGRLAASVVIAAERRTIDATRMAWFTSEDRAWRSLEAYRQLSPAEAARRLASLTGLKLFAPASRSTNEIEAARKRRFSGALRLSFDEPLRFVRASGQFMFDDAEWPFLDLYNNVCHVGHCHPRVVAAAHRQMARLNTNTRYLYDQLDEYAERLCSMLPESLECCFFVNSGSEANELALRLARAHTGACDVIVLDNAYHGHTTTLIEISPYKFKRRGGAGQPQSWVHVAPMPDGYRGAFKGMQRDAGVAFGNEVGRIVAALDAPLAAIIAETLPSCGGQVVPPAGYFQTAFKHVRSAGGVCILDEIQAGLGRIGESFWAFERHGVIPDILVLGKPLGNGHPLGAVVTTRPIAESFAATGREFFSTFGGNTVSCAVGIAVLDVIRDEGLQARALAVGNYFRQGLQGLMDEHEIIGDVRGVGLFLGIELVEDRESLRPATAQARELVNALRQNRVLLGTDGPNNNVIKIKPPLTLSKADASDAVQIIDETLRKLANYHQPRRGF